MDVNIDNNKMWEMLLENNMLPREVHTAIEVALVEQGLDWDGKHIVKIEPEHKYKVGDFVFHVNNGEDIIFQVEKVHNDGSYRIIPVDADMGKAYTCATEDALRPWTIQVSKKGDILYTPKGAGVEGIFLVSGWKNIEGTGSTLCSDVGYRIKDNEVVSGGLGAIWWQGVVDPFYPASREQREAFFERVGKEGFKWNEKERMLTRVAEPKNQSDDFTKFENKLNAIIWCSIQNRSIIDVNEMTIAWAKELLSIAESEKRLGITRDEFQKELELLYKYADDVQYKRGYEKGYEDAKKESVPTPHITCSLTDGYEEVASSGLHEQTKQMLALALERNGGDRKETAKELGISDRTLYRRLKQYGLDK